MRCSRLPCVVFNLLLCVIFVHAPLISAEQLSLPSADLVAPDVIHSPDTASINAGDSVTIKANVTDNGDVQSVILFYRAMGATQYDRLSMQRIPGSDDYAVKITQLEYPGIEYYIQATDVAGNTLLNGYAFSPLVISVTAPPIENDGGNTFAEDTTTVPTTTDTASNVWSNKWLWIGLGVLATGAAIAASDSGGDKAPEPTSIVISAPVPNE